MLIKPSTFFKQSKKKNQYTTNIDLNYINIFKLKNVP